MRHERRHMLDVPYMVIHVMAGYEAMRGHEL